MSETLALSTLVEAAQKADQVRREVERLRNIEQWALQSLHISEGDAVVITHSVDTKNGWSSHREVLVPGCTGVATGLYLSHRGHWACMFQPDVVWTVSDYPEPNTRRIDKRERPVFMFPIARLRRRGPGDEPLRVPLDIEATR